ncbi:MAG: hypothetical protein M1319_05400 [Chloroflexi bacterium]|nr:hypothetical protein [Chloroflexota bacterium]
MDNGLEFEVYPQPPAEELKAISAAIEQWLRQANAAPDSTPLSRDRWREAARPGLPPPAKPLPIAYSWGNAARLRTT